MAKTDPHKTHSYSHEQLILSAYNLELYNVRNNPKYDNVREILEQFMKDRIEEIKTRWK